jgi:ComF family protein
MKQRVAARSSMLSAWLHVLAPQRCAGCDTRVALAQDAFCKACSPLLEETSSAHRPPQRAASVFVYGGPLADAIVRLKYAGRTEIARALAAPLAEAALLYAGTVDRVLPLPLHAARLRERGFNQSALLSHPVARALGVPLDTTSLARMRPTREQASLPRDQRIENVRGAFTVRRALTRQRVLLIDDVRTTGATLAAAAEALERAGCADVKTLALARADG